MLVPGLPITALAIEAVVAGRDRQVPPTGSGPRFGEYSLRERARAWQARLLFAACYGFLVAVVAMAG